MSAEYQQIRVLWPDHLNLPRGKYLPAAVAAGGARHCITSFALNYDRYMGPVPGAGFLEGMPDLTCSLSLDDVRPGWEEGVGVVVGDLTFEGAPIPFAPREVLRRAVAAWEDRGFTPKVGYEFEAYLMGPDGDGGWKPYGAPGSFVYGTGHFNDPSGVCRDIVTQAAACGFSLESVNAEYDESQFEFTLVYDDAIAAADEAFLFKTMAREVAAERDLLLTFLPKPIADRGGNGLHVNLSFVDDSGDLALVDHAAPDGLSTLAKQCIAGQLAYLRPMTALCCPTVNSYKRLAPAQLCGYWQNWGHDHRCTTVRVNPERGSSTRLENRLADPAASPHIAAAAILTASRLGVADELECPPPETLDGLENVSCEVHAPGSLAEALDELEADETFVEAFGAETVAQFTAVKRTEWAQFTAHVTDWELDTYLPYL
ncbi:MAG: glutamine synthetase [Acidimicrobiia bacterium]|nr:glutamine synthetase [Acidimicrobiia bacterium]